MVRVVRDTRSKIKIRLWPIYVSGLEVEKIDIKICF